MPGPLFVSETPRYYISPPASDFGVDNFNAAQELFADKPLIGLHDLRAFSALHSENAPPTELGVIARWLRQSASQTVTVRPSDQYEPLTPDQAFGKGVRLIDAVHHKGEYSIIKTLFDIESVRDFALGVATEEPRSSRIGPLAIRYLVDLANCLPTHNRPPITIQYWPQVHILPRLQDGDVTPILTDTIAVDGQPTQLVTNRNLCWYTQAVESPTTMKFRTHYAAFFDDIGTYYTRRNTYASRGPKYVGDGLVRVGSYRTSKSHEPTKLWGLVPRRFIDLMERFDNPRTLPLEIRNSYHRLGKSVLLRYVGDLRRKLDEQEAQK